MSNEILNSATFGVEVEMFNITRAKAAQIVRDTIAAYTGEPHWNVTSPGGHLDERKIYNRDEIPNEYNVWKIESDSSIRARCEAERVELVTPVLRWESMPMLQEIIRKLRAAGARSTPDRDCGVHVHVGGEGHTAQTLRNLTNIMASHEQLLMKSIGVYAGRTTWCAPVNVNFLAEVNVEKPTTLDGLKSIWYSAHGSYSNGSAHYDDSRYHMLNLHSFFEGKGLEFRLFQFDPYNPSAPKGQRGAYMQGN